MLSVDLRLMRKLLIGIVIFAAHAYARAHHVRRSSWIAIRRYQMS